MNKFLARILPVMLAAGLLAACGQGDGDSAESGVSQESESSVAAESALEEENTAFSIAYPSYMQESEGEALTLDQRPEDIVVLSNSALQILIRCEQQPIAVTEPTSFVEYPDWVADLPVISTGKSTLDTETVISMEPDLVIMGVHLKEDYGAQLNEAGIPVYYTSEGPSITYEEVKEEAIALTRSFGTEEQAAQVEADFETVEKRAAEFQSVMEAKEMMILFGAPPSYQQTSKGYLGSILNMLPFENLSDTLVDPESRTTPLDLEKLVELNPEVLFAISPTAPSADTLKQVYEEEFAKNPDIWNHLQAVQNDNLIWLSSEYVTSKGIHIINTMNTLMDMLEEKFGS